MMLFDVEYFNRYVNQSHELIRWNQSIPGINTSLTVELSIPGIELVNS